ncbi:TPA: hypothetical protein ACXORD_005778, partial [Bacillus luti]
DPYKFFFNSNNAIRRKLTFFLLHYCWLSSLEFLVLSTKSLDFHVPLLRQESTYKVYDKDYFPTIVHEILV